ncbi:MAG: hypothetical protein H7A47_01040 [Verrucomicrobiales bacterium]|nr:hypothetical protein [Verrucomicrobiales bacterium]
MRNKVGAIVSEKTPTLEALAKLGRDSRFDSGREAWLSLLPEDLRGWRSRETVAPANVGSLVDHAKLLPAADRKKLRELVEKGKELKAWVLSFDEAAYANRKAQWHADISAGRGAEVRDEKQLKAGFLAEARGAKGALHEVFSEAWPLIQKVIAGAIGQLAEILVAEVRAERERFERLGLDWSEADLDRPILAIDSRGISLCAMVSQEKPARSTGSAPGDRLRACGLEGVLA